MTGTQRFVLYVLLFGSIILHEISHGWSALALGDDTAKRAGRLSLNPLVHVDVVGTLLVPLVLILSGTGVVFGWAKPVPVNVSRLRSPRNGAVATGLSGPAMNILIAGVALAVLRVTQPVPTYSNWLFFSFFELGLLNLWLAGFNLIPLPPLDGSSVVERLIPERWWPAYLSIRPYTLILVFGAVIVMSRTGAMSSMYNSLFTWWVHLAGYTV